MKTINNSLYVLRVKNAAVYSWTGEQKESLTSGIKYSKCLTLEPNKGKLSGFH